MFYAIFQANPGGTTKNDPEHGIAEIMLFEAESQEPANQRARAVIGSHSSANDFCECCGVRWGDGDDLEVWEHYLPTEKANPSTDVSKISETDGKPMFHWLENQAGTANQKSLAIHYENGEIAFYESATDFFDVHVVAHRHARKEIWLPKD